MSTAKDKSKVLIILPTLGQRIEYLKQSLESIRSQDYPCDLIMVYPLKNIKTSKLAKRYNAISLEDPGSLSTAINVGIAKSRPWHEYIGWLGDDDLLEADSIAHTAKALNDNPSAAIAYGYCQYIDDRGHKLFVSRAGKIAPWLMTWGPNLMPLPGMLFRKSALEEIGNFDESNNYSMDLDVLLKVRKKGYAFVNTKTVLASFRWHPDSMSVAKRKEALIEAAAVKKAFLPTAIRPLTFIWEPPVQFLSISAAKRLNSKAKR